MTGTIGEIELQRARWRRALEREILDTSDRENFALGGLAPRLRTPSVRLLLLPGDPEGAAVDIDDELWAWVKNVQVVNIGGRNVHLGLQEIPTAHAAVLADSYGSRELWSSYVAIHRSGAFEYGMGERGAWERTGRDGKPARVFNLVSIVARTWGLLKFATAFRDRVAVAGPYQLTVAMHRTGGALLGNVADGWAEPMTWENELPPCAEPHVLWHLELDTWPSDDEARDLAFRVGDRIEDAWGVRHRRYLARAGERVGQFDIRQLRE